LSTPRNSFNREAGHWYARRANIEAFALLALVALACWAVTFAQAGPDSVESKYSAGQIVPIPASVPHEAGDMVDSRIVPDLRWLAARYPIYVTDGYSGPLPNGEHVGCNNCHTRGSDHYNGLAVDIVPLNGSSSCDASWKPITRLALWAEPKQNEPVAPFRWVGYDGDAGHGCGNHLHLSWNHAQAARYQLAEWVELFSTGSQEAERRPRHKQSALPPPPPSPPGPTGGISRSETGGLSPRD
jgi:hypothetical protein